MRVGYLLHRVPTAILSSPLHRLMSRRRMVLRFTGRRTGTRYAVPINYVRRGHELLATTTGRWTRNLDGGAPVELCLHGRRVVARAETARDPGTVAEALTALIRDHPPYGRWANVRLGADGEPDAADVAAEVALGRALVRVRLAGPGQSA